MFGQAFLARGRGRGIDRLMVCGECPRQNTSHFWGLAREKKRLPIHVFLFRFFRGRGIESSLGNTKKKNRQELKGSRKHVASGRKPLSFVAFLYSTIIRFSSPVYPFLHQIPLLTPPAYEQDRYKIHFRYTYFPIILLLLFVFD